MKRFFVIAILLVWACSAWAQTDEYRGFQFGVSARMEGVIGSYWISGNATAGYRFNQGNYLGLMSGYLMGSGVETQFRGIPVRLDYINYIPLGASRRHSFIVGGELGGNYMMVQESGRSYDGTQWIIEPRTRTGVDPYISAKAGFDFNIADFTHLQLGAFWLFPLGLGITAGFTF
ncbi:MAG: hypothetical protein J5639_00940 [Bacteroidales bacterium]|nr:hypothetical protein [Bacteroidales bacterium]